MSWENIKYAMSLKSREEKEFQGERHVQRVEDCTGLTTKTKKGQLNWKINKSPVSFERAVSIATVSQTTVLRRRNKGDKVDS